MFQATHRSSSGAQKLYLQPLVLHTSVVAGHCHRSAMTVAGNRHRSGNRQPKTHVKPEAANTVFELLMMSDVSLETCSAIRNVGVINSNTWSHLVGYF